MVTLSSRTHLSAFSTSFAVLFLRTSRPRSGSPQIAPIAAAIALPLAPLVPGIPTAIPFLYMLPLTVTLTDATSSLSGSSLHALATASATAPGSVHPSAGLTSFARKSLSVSMIWSLLTNIADLSIHDC
ncbi:hypothetical protein SDC9_135596 [bioreactor metagenome]|uniref:Uncharacterized protein n=1 Tax=bioreactor metagenome TaxID=1076179 RepID=A0A645DIS0_9ZZZZ